MPPPLFFRTLESAAQGAADTPPRLMVFLHCMFVEGSLFLELVQEALDRAAAATADCWLAVLPDLRCHGQSWGRPGLAPPHTVAAMAADVLRTLEWGRQASRWGQPEVLIGHSLGGVVALECARQLKEAAAGGGAVDPTTKLGVPKQVWTLDCRVTAVAADHPSRRAAAALAGALAAVPEPFPSPDTLFEAAKQLLDPTGAKGELPWLRPFVEHAVKPVPPPAAGGPSAGFVRQYDTAAIPEMTESNFAADHKELLAHPAPCTLHIVAGLGSNAWAADGQEELALIRRQQAAGLGVLLHELAGDHWLPLTDPAELLRVMEQEFVALRA